MSYTLKDQLPRTWPIFFAPFGNLTEVQRRSIPVVLSASDTLIIAATASGKTEAALAPLLERYSPFADPQVHLLYLCPTRALARDVCQRLEAKLDALNVSLALKTGDVSSLAPERNVLVTTPESLDAMLGRAAKAFRFVDAVIIDEVHVFDETARGDQILALLKRIEVIRRYAGQPSKLQRVAISATVNEPQALAQRYLMQGMVVELSESQAMAVQWVYVSELQALATALEQQRAHKTLIFCNRRYEVEQVARYLQQHLAFESDVLVHYSNLDPELRRDTEARFASSSVAICVASPTLELGVDIGSLDMVVLYGAPPSRSAFWQRLGRAGRRGQERNIMLCVRSHSDQLAFEALLSQSRLDQPVFQRHFRLSVVVQQIFSLLKQSPSGGVTRADIQRSLPESLSQQTLGQIIEHLIALDYLKAARLGEWQAAAGLAELSDAHEIYSTIDSENLWAVAIDAYSKRSLAKLARLYHVGESLVINGRAMDVVWQDGYSFGVKPRRGAVSQDPRQRRNLAAMSWELAQAIRQHLGLANNTLYSANDTSGQWLFHAWGQHYALWLAALLDIIYAEEGQSFCQHLSPLVLHLSEPLTELPPWSDALARQAFETIQADISYSLELGRFSPLLAPALALEDALRQAGWERFKLLYQQAQLVEIPEQHRQLLWSLV